MANEQNLKPIKDSKRAKEVGAKGGRAKKGSKHLSTRIREFLENENFTQELTTKEGKKIVIKGEQLEAIMNTLVIKARNGDTKAAQLLFEYGWGSKVKIEATVEAGPSLAEAMREIISSQKIDNTKL